MSQHVRSESEKLCRLESSAGDACALRLRLQGILKYPDGSEKTQQKSGFKTEKEAVKAREKTIAELYNGTFVVYAKVHVADFMIFWLETDLKKRTDSHETYYNYCGIVKNHIIPILGKKK